jgi:hypothetical protein
MMTDTPETDNPLFELETPAAVLAFHHKHCGEAGVRELLAGAMSQPVPAKPWLLPPQERLRITTREDVMAAAQELEAVGIGKLAEIVHQHAATRPAEIDIPPYEPGTINHRAWLAGMRRKGQG